MDIPLWTISLVGFAIAGILVIAGSNSWKKGEIVIASLMWVFVAVFFIPGSGSLTLCIPPTVFFGVRVIP